ncbi:MAG: MFS transporter [Caulobacteraceae bacterium]
MRLIVLGLMMLTGMTTAVYVMNYLTTYATATLHMPSSLGFAATVAVGATGMVVEPLGGLASDRFGRKPVMMAPWALLLVATVPAFHLLSDLRSGAALIGLAVVLKALGSAASSSMLAALTEGLPAAIRSGAVGLVYALAITVSAARPSSWSPG